MLTKALIAVVMTGALYVAGDAVHKNVDCSSWGVDCCPLSWCCHGGTQSKASDGCSPSGEGGAPSVGAKKTTPACCSESK